ncbi:hypothetical protein [Parahaliea mediterranea]|uniref:MFS transporter n=1 Tax=Parahaliea mediterranea TaxID=651086 RepID=A0A939DH89_9GAMM|nr:hypothetical protein [Parahaliea mediterranea]MBN7797816.1 hypothetical protein [Parahaliea mediterranea]
MHKGNALENQDREAVGPYHAPTGTLVGLSSIYFLLFLSQAIWRATLHTNAVENFGLDGGEVGLLFSLYYLPGVFCFLIGLAATRLQLYRLVALSCALLSTGFIIAGLSGGFAVLATATLMVAVGFTVFYATANAICLISGQEQTVAVSLGRMKSLGPLSGLCAAITIVAVFSPGLILEIVDTIDIGASLREQTTALILFSRQPDLDPAKLRVLLLVLAAALVLAAGLFAGMPRLRGKSGTYGQLRVVRLLAPYYVLNFLAGCRSAIFQAFALFVMIRDFQLPIHATAVLVFAGNVCNFIGYRCIGHALVYLRHKTVVVGLYALVMLNFLGFWYLLTRSGWARESVLITLCGLFLLDSLLFGMSVVTDSFLRTTGQYSNYVGDIGTGMTFFYFAAVLMSLLGSALWDTLGYHAFLLGSLVCLLAMITGQSLQSRTTARPAM